MSEVSPKVIYDLGANDGSDIPYYLLKGDKVVAVEPIPWLADQIRERFAAEIIQGRLVVENAALTDDPSAERIPFYIHRTDHVLSQLPRPAENDLGEFEETSVPAVTLAELFSRHGEPYYLKSDLEGYDDVVLRDLFAQGVYPTYVSTEVATIDAFCTLVACGRYSAFKVVAGEQLARNYAQHIVETRDGPVSYGFPSPRSSGPFGNDICGAWMDSAQCARHLAYLGFGWVDVHASRIDEPSAKRVRKLAEIWSHVLRETGMRLKLRALLRASDRIWGVV